MENKETMVSVIIPVYQAEKYLVNCVESVLNQTYDNIEIILVDDGSNDGSASICDDYAARYDNIHCIHQKNKGVSCARNLGIERAQGKYILFVDSDDYIREDYLESAVLALKHEDIDIYLCGYQPVRKNGIIREKEHYPTIDEGERTIAEVGSNIMRLFFSSVLHAIGTKIYRKDIIDKYNIRFEKNWKYYEDIYFCLNYLKYCNKIYVQKAVMYYYQIDISNSLSKQMNNNKYISINKTYCLLSQLMQLKKVSLKEKEVFYKSYLNIINMFIKTRISNEKKYNVNISGLYKIISKDKIYPKALDYAGKFEKAEYSCIRNKLYFSAYIVRKLQNNLLEKKNAKSTDKNRALFLMMNQWVKMKQEGKNLSSYFKQNGYKKIAIYGMGYVGETLLEELKESGITVAYCIDKRAGFIYTDVDIVSMDDYLERVDVVVVTAITFFIEIEKELSGKMDCPIVSIEDILYEV